MPFIPHIEDDIRAMLAASGVRTMGDLHALKAQGILGGLALTQDYPELGDARLVCATETKHDENLERYTGNLRRILGRRFRPAPCGLQP